MSTELDEANRRSPTFPGSVDAALPPGFHRLRRERPAGHGSGDFERAATMALSWRMLRQAGLHVEATADRPRLGGTVVQRRGPFRAPCRIVEVIDEPRRAGFSYASLPGHPERGVERFLAEHRPDGSVYCVVESVSRAAAWYARLGGPVTRLVQRWMVGRYLTAMAG